MKGWNELDEMETRALSMKWMEVMRKGTTNCLGCGKKVKNMDEMKLHARREKDCFERLKEIVVKNPTGLG